MKAGEQLGRELQGQHHSRTAHMLTKQDQAQTSFLGVLM